MKRGWPNNGLESVQLPSVSVLIPCHNAEQWLGTAIESALACEGVVEVIVVDDGSTDRSREIARSFGPKIQFIEQPRTGGNAARNRLLAAARGEWIQFLDGDDYLEPRKIAAQIREAHAQGDFDTADILYSPVWIETWREGRAVHRTSSPLNPDADLFTQWITWQLPQTGGALWRNSSLKKLGGWNEAMPCCQEHELYLRALQANYRWIFCPTPGAVYRIWSDATVCRKDPLLVIRTRTGLIDVLLSWLKEKRLLNRVHRRAAGQAFFEMARSWARHDPTAAVSYLCQRRTRTPIVLRGPAAPWTYRIAFHLFGFRRAESLAQLLR